MSKKSKVAKATAAKQATNAAEAVAAVKTNPYVQRVVEDDDLRDNVRVAYESAQSAFARLSSGNGVPKQLVKDKKLHSDLQSAADALREIGESLVDAQEARSQASRPRRRCRPCRRPLRGSAQQGPRCAVRRRGGVRLHVDHHAVDAGALRAVGCACQLSSTRIA